jgi:hypothetical protein
MADGAYIQPNLNKMVDARKGLANGGRGLNTTKFKQNGGPMQRVARGGLGLKATKFKQNGGRM